MYIEVYHEYSEKQSFFDTQSQYFSVNYFQDKIANWVDNFYRKPKSSSKEDRSVEGTGLSDELGVDETERSSWLKPDPPDLLPHTYIL